MITSIFFKFPYLIFGGFFLYTAYMAYFFNQTFYKIHAYVMYDFFLQFTSTGICLLFMLPLAIYSKSAKTFTKSVENKVNFYARRFCSGFFFSWGGCFFVNSIVVAERFVTKFSKTNITWPQVTLLSILVFSILVLSTYFLPKKVSLSSFFGIILILVGFVYLYFPITRESLDNGGWALFVAFMTFLDQGWYVILFNTFMFCVFWMLTLKINRFDARYFRNSANLWLNTLLFGTLTALLLLPVSEISEVKHASCFTLIDEGLLSSAFITIALFSIFLFSCIQAFRFFETQNVFDKFPMLLNGWILCFLMLIICAFFYDKQHDLTLLKIAIIAVGSYFFWKNKQLQPSKIKITRWMQQLLLFLLSVVLVRMFLLVFYLGMWGGMPFALLFNNRMLYDLLDFINENGLIISLPLACVLCVYLNKKYSLDESVSLLLNYFFACIASLLAINLIKDTITETLYELTGIFLGSFPKPEDEGPIPEPLLWIQNLETVVYLLVAYISVKQGIQKGKRLIPWMVLSNMTLMVSLSRMFVNGVITMNNVWLHNHMEQAVLIHKITSLVIPLLVLFLSVLIYRSKNLDEKILPALLRCRLPRISEKQKVEEALSVLKEKKLISDNTSIQVLVAEIPEMNAYTIGDKIIAISEPLVTKLSSQQMAGVFSHELGHIRHKDGRLSVLLYVLNLPTILIKRLFNVFSSQRSAFVNLLFFLILFFFLYHNTVSISMFMRTDGVFLWFLLQTAIFLMENQDTQDSEWRADAYAATGGLAQELKEALMQMATTEVEEGFRESWMEKYPALAERIQRLEAFQTPVETI